MKNQKIKNKTDFFIICMTIAMIMLLIVWVIKDSTKEKVTELEIIEQLGLETFNKHNLDEIIEIIKNEKLTYVYIGYKGCGSCDKFVPILASVSKDYNLNINYLDMKEIDKASKQWKNFTNMITKEITLTVQNEGEKESQTKTIGKFLYEKGYTPTLLVFKDNKFVDGNMGAMNEAKLQKFLETVIEENS